MDDRFGHTCISFQQQYILVQAIQTLDDMECIHMHARSTLLLPLVLGRRCQDLMLVISPLTSLLTDELTAVAAGNPAVTSLLTADWLPVAGGAPCCLREDRAVQAGTCASCLVVEIAVNRKIPSKKCCFVRVIVG